MLTAVRAFAKSWVAAVLIGLLIISFAVFGLNDVLGGRMSDSVVKVGNRSVDSADFKRIFDRAKGNAEQQMGQPISVEMAAEQGFDRQILSEVASNEAFAYRLHKMGLKISDKLIAEQIAKIPAFFDQVSGRFDKDAYRQRLAENGLTPAKFEQEVRDDIAQQNLSTALVDGLAVPRAYAAMAAIYETEARDVVYFGVNPSTVPQPANPTDAQLTAFMKENAAQLMRPEFRVLTVARFSPSLAGADVTLTEADIKKRYDFRKDTLSSPETRTIVQIPAKDQATAQRLAAALSQGQDPTAVAKSAGVNAISYVDKPQTAIADRKAGAAAFGIPVGQVAPVQGDLGLAVVKVVAVKPGHAITLEEARPQIEAELRKDAAAEKAYALSQAYDEAHQSGASLSEAAQKAGVPTVTIGPLTAQGQDQQGQPVPGLSQKLLETAFALPNGGESQITDAGEGEYFAVRAERIIPAALPALADVRADLSRVWLVREMSKRMKARGDELAARVRKGESLEAVAAAAGSRVARLPSINRQNAQQAPEAARDLVGHALAAKAGEVFVAEIQPFGVAVGRIEAVRVQQDTTLARVTEAARPQMTMSIFREMGQSARAYARREAKVKVNENLARAAIGLPVLDPKKKAPAPAEKAK